MRKLKAKKEYLEKSSKNKRIQGYVFYRQR